MARTYFSAASTGESTNGTTTYTDKVALTLTAAQQAASTDYFILWSALLGNATSLTEDMKARLFNDTGAATLQEAIIEQQDLTDYVSVGGCIKWTSAGTPADNTFSIEFACETNDTILIKEARIVILKKETGDEYAESLGTSTTALDSYQDKVTLSFTPASQGDYLFVGSTRGSQSGSVTGPRLALHDGSANLREITTTVKDATTRRLWMTITKAASLSGSQTWKLQFRDPSGLTVGVETSALLALRLDTFPVAQYAESNAVSTTASASYQDKTTLTFTPTVTDHLLLSASHLGNASTTISTFARVDKGGAALQAEMLKEDANGDTTAPLPASHHLIHLEELTASSTTWKTQWHQESGATNAAIEQSAIAVLQLEASGGVDTSESRSGTSSGAAAVTGTIAVLDEKPVAVSAAATVAGKIAVQDAKRSDVAGAASVTGISDYRNATWEQPGTSQGQATVVGQVTVQDAKQSTVSASASATATVAIVDEKQSAVSATATVTGRIAVEDAKRSEVAAGATVTGEATYESSGAEISVFGTSSAQATVEARMAWMAEIAGNSSGSATVEGISSFEDLSGAGITERHYFNPMIASVGRMMGR